MGGGDVLELDRPVRRQVIAEPGQVVPAEGGTGDDAEPVLGEAGDREVALDAAGLVQQLRIGESADGAGDPVVRESLEKGRGTRPADLELGEGAEIEESRRLPATAVLGLDRRRPEAPGPPPRPE